MNNSSISDQSLMDKSLRSVFVGNIPYDATEEELKDTFSEVGPVISFKLVFDRETGKPKGYGFCEYKDQDTAQSAMRNLNGCEFKSRTLRVDNACTEKNRMEMQNLLQSQNAENPYGEAVHADKAPESISKAVASLPPEQMFELMKQMKLCVQNNPNEARQMLLQNPQLAYALLQAQVVMRIVDPHTAVNMLYKANPIPPVLSAPEKVQPVPPVIKMEEPWLPNRLPQLSNPPPPLFTNLPPVKNSSMSIVNNSRGQDVDLRQIDPRIARMDQDLRVPPPTLQQQPSMAPIMPLSDPRSATPFNATPEHNSFSRDPRSDRFSRDPRESRDPRLSSDPRLAKNLPQSTSSSVSAGSPFIPGTSITPSSARLMAGMSSAVHMSSGTTEQEEEKRKLIMQVLQLSDEQISMLPPDQRQSILVLKDQIKKSTSVLQS